MFQVIYDDMKHLHILLVKDNFDVDLLPDFVVLCSYIWPN